MVGFVIVGLALCASLLSGLVTSALLETGL